MSLLPIINLLGRLVLFPRCIVLLLLPCVAQFLKAIWARKERSRSRAENAFIAAVRAEAEEKCVDVLACSFWMGKTHTLESVTLHGIMEYEI